MLETRVLYSEGGRLEYGAGRLEYCRVQVEGCNSEGGTLFYGAGGRVEGNAGGRLENNPGGKWRVQVESWSTVQRARSTLRCRKAGVQYTSVKVECWSTVQVTGWNTVQGG